MEKEKDKQLPVEEKQSVRQKRKVLPEEEKQKKGRWVILVVFFLSIFLSYVFSLQHK